MKPFRFVLEQRVSMGSRSGEVIGVWEDRVAVQWDDGLTGNYPEDMLAAQL